MRRVLFSLLFLSVGVLLYAQEPVRFGDREVYLEANVRPKVRGHKTSSLELGNPTGERLNVLVQFASGKIAYEALKQKGVELGDYLGSNAYYAKVAPGSRPSDFVGTGIRSVVPIRGEWKVVHSLLQGEMPEWAVEGDNLKVDLVWFRGSDPQQVKAKLRELGVTFTASADLLRTAHLTATREQVLAIAEEDYVAAIHWPAPPMELNNYRGARLSGGMNLRQLPELGGRGLTGKGVRLGIWDGNVGDHVDYGNRVHREEFEITVASSGGHGMHTTGTILGAGLLDERARGMAPEAEIWTWNFNKQSNGKTVAQEMLETQQKYNISITSNSYGLQVSSLCNYAKFFNYTVLGNRSTDILAYYIPTLTHCFSAGNDQGVCNWEYGHMSNYAKNIITVAALTPGGEMTDFSSFGPFRDGRLAPIIAARGQSVYSVMPKQSYEGMSGTSMSCPTVAGHLALLTQRWGQLHGGALPFNYYLKALIANTADDGGNAGPDYQFGFGTLNALAAVTAMENNWHTFKSLKKGVTDAQEQKINVPEGVKELRVMICWNDPVADKEYKTGECPLVNDLDLTVANGFTTYFPYTLDPAKPNNAAVADKKNAVDNIEQVVVKTPTAGEYTISVKGDVKQEDEQNYVVVWYFDYKRPAITSPMAGDVYSPSDEIFLRTENLAAKLKVELSTDGGATYQVLKANASLCDSIAIPVTTPPTDKATLRVTDANNQIVQTSGFFTIMPQVKGLALTEVECTTDGWKLNWDAAEGAEKYEILRADVEKGIYTTLKVTDDATTNYVLEAGAVKPGERNIYAVRAINAQSIKGPRSIGVLATGAAPLTITSLPYLETFMGSPFRYLQESHGENLAFITQEASPRLGLSLGSTLIAWQASKPAPEWENPFTEQRNNVASIKTCKVKLPAVTGTTKLQLTAYYFLAQSAIENGTLLRLLVDGVEKQDVLGRAHLVGDGGEHFVTYDLTDKAGSEVSLTFESALANGRDLAIMVYYRLYETDNKKDVGIAWVNDPEIKAQAQMQDETISFKLLNYTANEMTKVPVSVQVDDQVVYSTIIETLKPFEDRTFAVKHNFASDKAREFKVVVTADVEGDQNIKNNTKSFEVYNMGNVIAMPEIQYIEFWGMLFPQVPRIATKINGRIGFTDGQGSLRNYKESEEAVLQVLPSNPNATVQVKFSKYEFNDGDELYVYTGNVPASLRLTPEQADYVVKGKSNKPLSFVSHAFNGGLTFLFKGAEDGEPGVGWEAELSEVALLDKWELTALKEIDGSDADHKKLGFTIKNRLPIELKNVVLYVTVNDDETKEYVIPELKASADTEYVIDNGINVTEPMRASVMAELDRDGQVANNKASLAIIRDKVWQGGGKITQPSALTIVKFEQLNEQNSISLTETKYVDYRTKTTLPFYTTSVNNFRFTLSDKPTALQANKAAIRLFIDNDDDNELAEVAPELYKVDLKEGQKEYTLAIDFTGQTTKPGKHRMRILLANDANYARFKQTKEIEWGQAVDFTAEIIDAASPFEYEMGIIGITNIASGRKGLTNQTPIQLELVNNGLGAVKEITLSVKADDTDAVEKTIKFNSGLAAGAKTTVTIPDYTADFSVEGSHTIEVKLLKEDANNDNNGVKLTFLKLAEIGDKLYSLAFEGIRGDILKLSKIENVENEITIEGWWRLNMPQTTGLFDCGEGGVYMGVYVGNANVPTNALILFSGECAFYSEKTAVAPGVWHHIAATVSQVNKKSTIHAYVDGVEVSMKQMNADDGFVLGTVKLNSGLKGENLMFRMWNKVRTAGDLKANMTKSVRTGAERKVPADCLAELIFTEGKGRLTSYGDESTATITGLRPDASVWKLFEPKPYTNVAVEDQVIPVQIDGENIVATMPSNFNTFNNVKVKFVSDWDGVEIKQGNTTVTDATALDFSAGDHSLPFTLKLSVFGKTVTENVTIKLINDKSEACDMLGLTMKKDKNLGLKNDITKNGSLNSLIELEAENESETSVFNPKKVVLQVTGVSEKAKLYLGEELLEAKPDKDITVDLTSPVTFKVVAENERDVKFYAVRLSMTQEIIWDNTLITCNYGDADKILDAKASSKLSITYVSENPDVAIVDGNGKLVTVGVGSTKIFAKQAGNAIFKPAADKERQVKVDRVAIMIRVKDAEMEQGEPLPELEFEYDKLVYPNTESQFEAEYKVCNLGTTVEAVVPLVPGTYSIVPAKGTNAYELGNYMVTRQTGKLTVRPPVKAKKVTFVVKDENNAPLQGAVLMLGTLKATTGVGGKASIYRLPAKYTVIATKAGYASDTKDFEVKDADQTIELKLLKKNIVLTYTADEHGMIQGVATQHIAKGANGVQVVAVSKDIKYRFKEWDDNNSREAARIDKGVNTNITAKAIFETFKYELKYEVTEGGEFTPATIANKTQQVVPSENGTVVEVQAKAGYYFVGWSDGKTELMRTDLNIMSDQTITARFAKPNLITWTEDFDAEDFDLDAWNRNRHTVGMGWQIIPKSSVNRTLEGYCFSLAAPLESPFPNYPLMWTASPWLSIDGHAADAKVIISFERYAQGNDKSVAMLEYCFENGAWTKALDIDQQTRGSKYETFILDNRKLGTNKALRFRWSFNPGGGTNTFLLIDNIKVAYETPVSAVLRYIAAENGKVQKESETPVKDLQFTTNIGTNGAKVKAVADAGYVFDRWSDDLLTEERQDDKDLTVTAYFRPALTNTHVIHYIADENGSISGLTYQVVPQGQKTTGVTAIPNKYSVFNKWEDNNSIEPYREDVVGAEDRSYKALFTRVAFALTYKAGMGGEIKGMAQQVVKSGENGTEVEAVAKDGYRFVKWDDGKTEARRTDNNVTADKTYTAEFEAIPQFTLTYKAGVGGTIVGNATQTVNAGDSGSEVEAKANLGYHFVKWDDGKTEAKRTDANVTANATYTAEFEADVKTFTVTLTQGAHGTISIKDYTTEQLKAVPANTELTVVVEPATGWKLKSLMADTQDIKEAKKFTVTADVEVTVEFEEEGGAPQPNTYAVTLAIEGEGTLKVTGIEESKLNAVPENTELVAVATPKTGWTLKSLKAGDKNIKSDGKFTVTADVEVKAVFEKITPVDDAVLASIEVAPNPFSTQLRISCDEFVNTTYKLFNASGVVVRSGNFESRELTIETTDLASGLYLLHLTAESGATKVVRVVKE